MNTDKIKVGHSYSMMPINGRRTIARVTNLFKITAMAANKEHEIETLELNPTVVRFVWRHAAYPTGWSRSKLPPPSQPRNRRFPPPWSVDHSPSTRR